MYESLLEEVSNLARKCGEILKDKKRSEIGVEMKEGHGNLVTKYDRMVEDILKRELKEIMPEAKFYGEEEEVHSDISKGYAFIVDPIDGTTNFVMNANYSAISIGFTKDLERLMGVVYNPFTDEMFTAIKGQGAFLNGNPIHVSSLDLCDMVAIFGSSPYYSEYTDFAFNSARHYFDKALDIRRYGTASLDMCSVAAGRAAIYYEERLSPWDYAAGSLIVEEAGGIVTRFDGSKLTVNEKSGIIAVNKPSAVLKEVFNEYSV